MRVASSSIRVALSALVASLSACTAASHPRHEGGSASGEKAAASGAATPLRYSIPPCVVAFDVETDETDSMEGDDRKPSHLLSSIALEGRPDGGHWTLTGALTARVAQGKYRPFAVPNRAFAPVHLETTGAHWTEVDGATMLFRSLGTSIGIALLFPELPTSGAAFSTAAGSLVFPSPKAVFETESARGTNDALGGNAQAGMLSDAAPAPPLQSSVRLEEWTDIGGVKAAVLTEHASGPLSGGEDEALPLDAGPISMRIRGTITLVGRYVVLSSGVLLRATVDKETEVEMTTVIQGKTSTQRHHGKMHTEARLTRACGGPTERSVEVPMSSEERAIEAWGETAVAILGGERDKALSGFAPEVRKRGDDAVWEALSTYHRTRGDHAVPLPLFVEDRDVTTTGDEVHLTTQAITPDGRRAHYNVPLGCQMTMKERDGLFENTHLRCDLTLQKGTLLDIGPDKLVMVKGWPWPPER